MFSSSSHLTFSSMEFLTKLERLDLGCNELEELVSLFQLISIALHLNNNTCICLGADTLYFNFITFGYCLSSLLHHTRSQNSAVLLRERLSYK